MFPMFFSSPSGSREVLFHYLMSSSSQSSRSVPHMTISTHLPRAQAGWLEGLGCFIGADERQCIWWMSSSYSVVWMICRWETSKRDSSGGRRKTEGRLCALRKLARFVGGDGARASALCLSGPLFSAHSSTFFDLDEFLVRIRFFLWCKQQSPPGDPAPPRLVETLVTEGCRRKLKFYFISFRWSSIVVDSFIRSFIFSMWFRV
jgi:hypothetical protein